MLIVSKFHDYYDSASSYGIDKTCVYKRKSVTIKIKKYANAPSRCASKKFEYEIIFYVIGFCGRVFPLVETKKYLDKSLMESDFIYAADEVIRYFERENVSDKPRYGGLRYIKTEIKRHFEQDWSSLEGIFVEERTPVFVFAHDFGDHCNLQLNPELRRFMFFRVKDAHSAFQDIFMYISGVLGAPPKPMVQIADKYKQAAHGHDGEYSFKKPPGKKVKWR